MIEQLSTIPEVFEVNGAMKVTPVGGGRPALITNDVERRGVEETVEAVHRSGLLFCYLLNAPCMGNMEFDIPTHRALLDHLEWLSKIGVDGLTLTIPYLIALVKKQFPHFYIRVSVIASVNTVPRAKYFMDLGADSITVDYMKNRDFRFLAALKKQVSCDFTLLLNDQCLFQCPYRNYHYNVCGHASQSFDPQDNYYFDYSLVRCMMDKLKKPERLLMMPCIRPEDISQYESLGFENFKVSGRHMETDALVRAIRAYVGRRFDGNLLEILNPFVAPGDAGFPYVDNRALDGFLEQIKDVDCENSCGSCDRCRRVAKRAVKVDKNGVEGHLKLLERYIDGLTESRFLPRLAERKDTDS